VWCVFMATFKYHSAIHTGEWGVEGGLCRTSARILATDWDFKLILLYCKWNVLCLPTLLRKIWLHKQINEHVSNDLEHAHCMSNYSSNPHKKLLILHRDLSAAYVTMACIKKNLLHIYLLSLLKNMWYWITGIRKDCSWK
jgi:hypothetical protein